MEGGGGGGQEDKEWRGKGSITSKIEETDNKEKVEQGKKIKKKNRYRGASFKARLQVKAKQKERRKSAEAKWKILKDRGDKGRK